MPTLRVCGAILLAALAVPASGLPSHAQADGTAVPQSGTQISLSFAPVVKKTAPAVVNIYTSARYERARHPFAGDPFFEQFFGELFGPRGDYGRREFDQEETPLGSGVLLREDGYIVTNAHVVDEADEITIALADRREFPARVLLNDAQADLAILKIDARGLPHLSLRNSDSVEVGDLVLAIGNPFGIGQTVTSGIISAEQRASGRGQVYLQTDAAINPGNSGGALVDMQARLIGINTAILSRSGGSHGVGFAVPSNLVLRALSAALSGSDRLSRAWLGVSVQEVTAEIAESLGFTPPKGVMLVELHPLSPLARIGLVPGDVVLSVNGQPVSSADALAYRFEELAVGERARLIYMRHGTERVDMVTLIGPPEDPPRNYAHIDGRTPFSGAVVANLNPALAAEEGFSSTSSGVVVYSVRGVARRFGLRPGDVILNINGAAPMRVAELESILSGNETGRWDVQIKRGERVVRLVART